MTDAAVPENALEAAIADALEGRGDPQRALGLLWTSSLVVPKARESGAVDALDLATVTDESGRRFLPVYSSPARMAAARPEGGDWVGVRLADLAEGWPHEVGVAVNPGAPFALVAEIDDVAAAAQAGAVENRVVVGEPAEEPLEALAALGEILGSEPEVVRAHRAQFLDPQVSFEPQLAIGLELAPDAPERETFERVLARSQRQQVDFGRPTAFMLVTAGSSNPVAAYMWGRARPFYEARPGIQ